MAVANSLSRSFFKELRIIYGIHIFEKQSCMLYVIVPEGKHPALLLQLYVLQSTAQELLPSNLHHAITANVGTEIGQSDNLR